MTWNRLLLLAYPKGPRRAEVLDTLTMAAEDGGPRQHPINLVRYGLRARLGRPRSRTVVVLSLLLALAGGFLAASATNRLAWEAGPSLPGAAPAQSIAALVAPGLTLEPHGGDAFGDGPFGYPPGEEVSARMLYAESPGTPGPRDAAAMTALRHRLEAAGWEVTAQPAPDGDDPAERQALTARRDGLILHVGDNPDRLIVFVNAAEPVWISLVTVAGGLLGAVAAWLLTAAASRHAERSRTASVLAATAAWLGLLLLWAPLRFAAGYLPELLTGDYDPGYPFWAWLTWASEYGPSSALAVILFVVACGLALARRSTADPVPAVG